MKSFLAIIFMLYISNVSAARAVLRREVGRRQTAPSIAACVTPCDNLDSASLLCTTSSDDSNAAGDCRCSDDIASNVTACYTCSVANGFPVALAQQVIANLEDACQGIQHPFAHPPTLSGSGSSGSGSSAASSGSSPSAAATGSGSASPSTITSTGKNGAGQVSIFHAVSVALSIAGVASMFLSA